ncbi:GYF domain-containing protein [Candidatus Laterigemmans baculatus]|uniref:GYF domain-containing protein n=1 Tax=Candidatus Laterigemmans baculatus TaxID=2770505 RepID=UPI0013DAECA8|nr:GYF domain-containing protein [Candidatus Laterigemmans baculatus]
MGIRFACHACNKPLNIKESLAGKRGKCPRCGARFRIPTEDREFSLRLDDPSGEAAADVGPDEAGSREATSQGAGSQGADSRDSEGAGEESDSASIVAEESAVTEPTGETEQPPFDPLADPLAQWYVRPASGGQYGPADGPTVRQWVGEQRLTAEALLWRDGWAEWRAAGEVLGEVLGDTPAVARSGPSVKTEPSPAIAPGGKDSPSRPAWTPGRQAGSSGDTLSSPAAATAAPDVREQPTEVDLSPASAAETYLGARRRRKQRQRTVLIGTLIVASLLLVAALVLALLGGPILSAAVTSAAFTLAAMC